MNLLLSHKIWIYYWVTKKWIADYQNCSADDDG